MDARLKPTLVQFTHAIAELGGYLGRKGNGPPHHEV